jgi:formate dehydrogenase maturation protein FdhE
VTAEIRKQCEQQPTYLFVDCSNGVDRRLRALAEQSMDDFMRRIEQFPVVLMALRLLDHGARYDSKLKKLHQTRPYATDWLNVLGELLHQRREEAQAILYDLERKAEELAERLQEDYADAAEMLKNNRAQPNPVWRLAEALTSLQGRGNTQQNLITLWILFS